MSIQGIGSFASIAPKTTKTDKASGPSTGEPVYVRASVDSNGPQKTAVVPSQGRLDAKDGVANPAIATTLNEVRHKMELAVYSLKYALKPGQAVDLGKFSLSPHPGYLCRMTNSGNGYVLQTHEQARTAPFSGLFFPAEGSQANIAMNMTPVTDPAQIPNDMYNMLHSISRFMSRKPIESLLIPGFQTPD